MDVQVGEPNDQKPSFIQRDLSRFSITEPQLRERAIGNKVSGKPNPLRVQG
jgi:hypothetical protein